MQAGTWPSSLKRSSPLLSSRKSKRSAFTTNGMIFFLGFWAPSGGMTLLLSMESCVRAMMRDARKIDHLIETDPFAVLDWPRLPSPKPDPFTEDERDKIIRYFREKNRFYYPFAQVLFWTGMRPSEALALREDIDLRQGFLSISKSRYLNAENSPKTAASESPTRCATRLFRWR